MASYKCQIIVAGDFNIHVECPNDKDAAKLNDILLNFDCKQHVSHEMTHGDGDGGMLDLVITKSNEQIEVMSVKPPDIYSDHSLISWQLSFYQQLPIMHTREVRMWRKLDNENFSAAIHRSSLCDVNNRPAIIEEYFDRYQSVLEEMADTFAPVNKFTPAASTLSCLHG